MSTMQQRHAVYAAYAELESAAEAFHNASNAMSAALREINEHDTVERLNTVCEDYPKWLTQRRFEHIIELL